MDVQVQLVHGRHSHGKEIMLVRRVDEDLRATLEFALGGLLDQHQRSAIGRVFDDRIGMPGNVGSGVAQEIVVAQLRPELLGIVRISAVAYQIVECCALRLADLFFATQRVFQSAFECALGFCVQLAQQAGAPGIP